MKRLKRLIAAAGLVTVIALPTAHAAQAQTPYTGGQPPAVGSSDQGGPSDLSHATPKAGTLSAQDTGSRFAVTGADISELSIIGAGAILTGVFLKRRARTA
jgi:hypothetical protein